MIGIVIIAILVIALVIINSFALSDSDSSAVQKGYSDKEKLAKFEADMGCQLMDAKSEDEAKKIIGNAAQVAQKYGLSMQQVQALEKQYQNDDSVKQMVADEMKKLCPEKLPPQQNQDNPITVN